MRSGGIISETQNKTRPASTIRDCRSAVDHTLLEAANDDAIDELITITTPNAASTSTTVRITA